MPELPEVEFGRKLAERTARGRTIRDVRCDRDEIVFDGDGARAVQRDLRGRSVCEVRRRGKYIWFELDQRPWPLFHFGMTGAFRVKGEAPLRLESSPKILDGAWPPRFSKIHLFFDGGVELVMTDKRRLGRIRLLPDPPSEPPVSELGFDAYLDLPPLARFRSLLAARKGVLKGVLLDQSFAAGVGNWIADEVLFQACLDPRRRADSLAPDEIKALHAKLKSVIRTAVRVDADKDRLPKSWLFHHRWGKAEAACTADGAPVRFVTLAGRTTAWVPSRQR